MSYKITYAAVAAGWLACASGWALVLAAHALAGNFGHVIDLEVTR